MMRINLLPHKRAKRARKSQNMLLLGLTGLILVGGMLYVAVHRPLLRKIARQTEQNRALQQVTQALREETKDFDIVTQKLKDVELQAQAIARLNQARSVPAWLLRELAQILTKDRQPAMSAEMQARIKTDHNRQWSEAWDPKRIWVESFDESGGTFKLKGAAQSDSDVTQLALRMQASVYFAQVVPEGVTHAFHDLTKVHYYTFTITGKVAY